MTNVKHQILLAVCPPGYPNLTPSVDTTIERGLSVHKCCPAGHIVEGDQCQPLKIGGKVNSTISESALLEAIQTFSEVLTGLNLLCHIFSLSITFIALSIGQQDIAGPGEGSCTALGEQN